MSAKVNTPPITGILQVNINTQNSRVVRRGSEGVGSSISGSGLGESGANARGSSTSAGGRSRSGSKELAADPKPVKLHTVPST